MLGRHQTPLLGPAPAIHGSKGSCWSRTEPGGGITWKLTRSSLGSLWKRLCLPDKWFQVVFHALGQEGPGSSQRHLGWDSAPSVALLLLSHQESWDPSFPKNPGGSSTASTSPAQGQEGSLTSSGLLVSLGLTSCNFLIHT